MYNIRIKSVPNKAKTGSQLDYSLVDRNTLFLKPSDTNVDSDVKNTIGAVPREMANIEAEGGETIVGDINNDGYLEHQTIVGKRHSQGGVPMNVPDGSFIFSDTKKLKIKDPNVLSMFGMNTKKEGYTPAEIAKKYQINDYIAIQRDPAKDVISKRTAELSLSNNLKKLGMLALVQESMKGFPDGIPAIAESVMAGLQEGNQQTEMQYGGYVPKAQVGGLKLSVKDAEILYNNALKSNDPKKIQQAIDNIEKYKDSGWYSWGWVPGSDENKFESYQQELLNAKNKILYSTARNNFIKKYEYLNDRLNKEKERMLQGLSFSYLPDDHLNTTMFDMMNKKYNKLKNAETLNNSWIVDDQDYIQTINESSSYLDKMLKSFKTQKGKNETKADTVTFGENNTRTESEKPDVNSGNTPVFKPKQKPAPTASSQQSSSTSQQTATTNIGDINVKYNPNADFAYGGNVQYMQNAGQTNTQEEDPIVEYERGPKGGIKAKTASGKYIDTPYTKYLKWDNQKGTFRLEVPSAIPYEERIQIADFLTKNKGFKNIIQSSDYKINPKDYYEGFYAGLKPEHFEDRLVREQLGNDATNALSPLDKRKKAFEILGIDTSKIPLATLANTKQLYTPEFTQKTFYPAFTKFLPEGAYRPELGNDVRFGFEHYDALKAKKPVQQQTVYTPNTEDEYEPEKRNYYEREPIVGGTGWSKNATLNFMNAALGQRYRGFPYLAKVDLQTPGYVLEAPNQLIQNAQSSLKNVTDLAQNTMPGNVAVATSLGVTGQGLEQAANVIAGVNNRNVQTVNQFSNIAAGIENQEEMFNRGQALPKFVADVNILGQQNVNSANKFRSNLLKAAISANKEQENLELMKKMYPGVGINNWDRSIGWSGNPRSVFGFDTYVNPMMMNQRGSRGMNSGYVPDPSEVTSAAGSVYQKAYKDMFTTMGEEKAKSYAEKLASAYANKMMGSYNPYMSNNNGAAMFASMYGSATPDFMDFE